LAPGNPVSTVRKRYRSAAPLADLVGKAVADAFAKQGFAAIEIVTHWEDVVGADLARRCEPMRLAFPRRDDPGSVGTLLVRAESAYAIEIQHLAPVIIDRVNRYFGWRCVGRISIRQGPVVPRKRRPAPPPEPPAAAVAEIERSLGPFEDKDLQRSLARLGALVKSGLAQR
jgi:hypothetical protein